ncbi:MAG: phosphoglucosamine mutase [Clostridia bacterium]|nr:phosphoglucosamine mutase [Clostridia bacterium]
MGKLFGTDGIRGIAGGELTAELAFRLGLAVSQVLVEAGHRKTKVIIGKDTRHSGDMFEAAITAGLCAAGSDVCLLGVVPTPAIAYLVCEIGADAGVMISASHNPGEYNGIKVFGSAGYKLSDELEARIEELILGGADLSPGSRQMGHLVSGCGLVDRYVEHVAKVFTHKENTAKKRVLFDLSNGSACTTAKKIFSPENFPNFECCFMANDPDGTNINQNCGSTRMDALCRLVREKGYDIGIAFDGDADRCLLCDENGQILDGDHMIAALSFHMKDTDSLKKNTVVVTSMTNLGFHQLMKREGTEVRITDVGDRYVLEEMLRCGANLGGEQSGHVILLDHATTGDGQITAALCLDLLVARHPEKTASEIFGVMRKLPQVLINVTVPNEKKQAIMSSHAVLGKKDEIASVLGENGRILLRPSGTESYIRIMLEGNNEEALHRYANALKAVIEGEL